MTQKCKDRVENAKESRLEDLRLLWAAYMQEDCPACDGNGYTEKLKNACRWCDHDNTRNWCQDPDCESEWVDVDCPDCRDHPGKIGDEDGYIKDLGNMYEYGLSFDYVAPGTFSDQNEGYFRYQISWGGPSEEFRIYADQRSEYEFAVYRIEFWFLDWFDGAPSHLSGEDLELLTDIFNSFFAEVGTASHVYNEALEL